MMKSFQQIGLLIFFLTTSALSFSMTLCQDPVVAGAYENSPTCLAATDASNRGLLEEKGLPYREFSPYVATLEPVLDQDQKRYIFNAYYRYIDLPPGQSFKWYLDDGDPDTQAYIEITPTIMNDQLQIEFEIKNLAQISNLFYDLIVAPSGCTGSIVSGYQCSSFNDFLSIMKPFIEVLGFTDTVNYLSSLKDDEALKVVEKIMEDDSKESYLSIRYVQTCSGGLLADGKVITAGHCYYTTNHDKWDSANSHKVYIAGSNWQTSPYVAMAYNLSPDSDNIAPNYEGGSLTDYAIVKTQTINGYKSFSLIEPFEISAQKLSSGQNDTLYQVGFGQTEPFDLFYGGEDLPAPTDPLLLEQYYRSLSSPVALIGQQSYLNSEDGDATIYAGNTSEAAGGYGDSGGPLYSVAENGTWLLRGTFDTHLDFANNQNPSGFRSSYYLCKNKELSEWLKRLDVSCRASE